MEKSIGLNLKRRILIIMCGFIVLTMLLGIRLGYVQVIEGKKLQELADEQQTRNRNISPTRGNIYDKNLNILAKSASVSTIGTVYAQIKEPERVAKVLSENLGIEYEEVYKKVTKRVAFMRIATKVDKEVADKIRAMNLPGVKVDEDSKRYYPYNSLASQTLGFVGKDNQGIIGLEVKYDSYLKGSPGTILMETNGKGERRNEEAEVRVNPKNGDNLVTTLDLTLQQYAEQAIDKAVEMKDANRGAIIMMNPQNGEIYALAIKPDFDLNEPFTMTNEELKNNWDILSSKEQQEALNQMWRNFTINDTYEPGSTFKIFTSAMGLEEGVVSEESKFTCTGSKVVAGRAIKCWRSPRSHGDETFVQGVQNSCNPVFMEVAERIGANKFYDYMVKFGFKEKTHIDLPGEAAGILHIKANIGPVELATMSFGQSFQITPMELLSAGAAAVNGGYKVTPHFGDKIIDDKGEVVTTFEYGKGEQIISKETSERLKKILESVVSEGGGNKAYIPGYRIGGKTATSQKLPRGSGKYTASFLSFAPAENPTIMTLVIIDEPKGTYYGGVIAGPVMKEVLENALPYLGIEPVYNEQEKQLEETQKIKVPMFAGKTVKEAKEIANTSQCNVDIVGEGNQILSQFPKEGEEINKITKIILYTE